MKEENGNKIPEIKVDAVGHAENPPKIDTDAVEYNGGARMDPMEELVAESINEPKEESREAVSAEEISPDVRSIQDAEDDHFLNEVVPNVISEEDEKSTEPIGTIDKEKIKMDPTPTESKKATFNPESVQDARTDSRVEGGIMRNKSTGPAMSEPEAKNEAEAIKPTPDMMKDSLMNKYEVTGFEVDYNSGGNTYSTPIRDYFDDLEAAFASVNDEKYLMPMPNGFKVATIRSGAPTISYNERQIYNYKNGKWSRT